LADDPGMSLDRVPTFRRRLAALDPISAALLPVVVVALAAMYDATGDALSFFGEPGDPSAGPRSAASGGALLAVAYTYAKRGHGLLAAIVGVGGAVTPALLLAFPDTGYGLLAIWTLGPLALGSGALACVRARAPLTSGRPTTSATMDAPHGIPGSGAGRGSAQPEP
jgi:hypothetical protein